MSAPPSSPPPPPSSPLTAPVTRPWWITAVGVRLLVGVVALPLTPVLFADRFPVLLAMRPTREFLLLAGFRVRADELELAVLLLVTLPMVILGHWVFFGLGRAYRDDLAAGNLPPWLARSVDPEQVARLRGVLARRGVLLVVLARLAIFPATLLAAAAGTSDLPTRRFLLADTASATLAYIEYVGAGYVLGRAYENAGAWITVAGVTLLIVILWIFGRALRDDGEDAPARRGDPAWRAEPEPETPTA